MADINVQLLFDKATTGDGCAIRDEVFGKPGGDQIKAFHELAKVVKQLPKSTDGFVQGSNLKWGLIPYGLNFQFIHEFEQAVAKNGTVVQVQLGSEHTGGQFIGAFRAGIGGGDETNPLIEIDTGPDINHLRPIYTEEILHYNGPEKRYECVSKPGAKTEKKQENTEKGDYGPLTSAQWINYLKG